MLFNDSEALREEYAKLGEAYEETEPDKHWKFILNQIKDDPNKKETIQEMTRIALGPGEEYIVYHHMWEGKNPIGSYIRDSQGNVGVYPKFEPQYERYITEDNTYAQRLVSKNPIISYFIKFTKEKADELHKLCNDGYTRPGSGKTAYYVQPEGGTKITVNSYKDWRDGDFEDLHEHGKITAATVTVQTKQQKS